MDKLTDANAREHILELDRKLKSLRAEIDAKLKVTEEDRLIHLMQEIEQAINTLTPVVTLAATDKSLLLPVGD